MQSIENGIFFYYHHAGVVQQMRVLSQIPINDLVIQDERDIEIHKESFICQCVTDGFIMSLNREDITIGFDLEHVIDEANEYIIKLVKELKKVSSNAISIKELETNN